MNIQLAKAGTNPDQALTATIEGPDGEAGKLKVGDVFHVAGQPPDVKWRVVSIAKARG